MVGILLQWLTIGRVLVLFSYVSKKLYSRRYDPHVRCTLAGILSSEDTEGISVTGTFGFFLGEEQLSRHRLGPIAVRGISAIGLAAAFSVSLPEG